MTDAEIASLLAFLPLGDAHHQAAGELIRLLIEARNKRLEQTLESYLDNAEPGTGPNDLHVPGSATLQAL